MIENKPCVGVISEDDDLGELVEDLLKFEGLWTVAFSGWHKIINDGKAFRAFLVKNTPLIIVVDVPYPPQPNWRLLQDIKNQAEVKRLLPGIGWVYTSSADALKNIIGHDSDGPFVPQPFDLDEMVRAVKSATIMGTEKKLQGQMD